MHCQVGDCRFSQAEAAASSVMWDSDQFCRKQLEALVDARLEGFDSPPSIDQSAIGIFSGAPEQQRATTPSLAKLLVICLVLTNQVEESFTGREGLTELYSMAPFCDLKKIHLVSSQPFAVYSWLMTVEQSNHIEQVTTEVLGNVPELPLVPVERACIAAVVQLAS